MLDRSLDLRRTSIEGKWVSLLWLRLGDGRRRWRRYEGSRSGVAIGQREVGELGGLRMLQKLAIIRVQFHQVFRYH